MDRTAKLCVVALEAPSFPTDNQLEATMRRIAFALVGLLGAATLGAPSALANPWWGYEIDPLSGQSSGYYGQQEYRPQASTIGRQVVPFSGRYGAGTIVISTAERRLYYTLGNGQAIQYAVGVGRPGFEWSGTKPVTMKREWPDWRPPAQMLKRRPDLPRYMSGGVNNPLGARAMYLGGSLYRIHGSNEPETIGQAVSSGCIRMTNEDVIDLYSRTRVGTRVVVMR
jgi:lipoprotein-anchoring transpeptidase ErfK/SrfK